MQLRLATEADLEAMTAVLIGASPDDPVYPYRFPDRHLYPDEFAALCRRKCAEYLETSTVVVCEMPDDAYANSQHHPSAVPTRVVAFSAWDMPFSPPNVAHARRASRSSIGSRGSMGGDSGAVAEPSSPTSATFASAPTTIGNATRQTAFRTALAEHKARLFDARYRALGGHVFLKILLCHPSWQRRGAGTALACWGIEHARALGVHTTVFASPMGMRLYRKLGFREVGRFRVQLEGDCEFLEIPALALGPGHVGAMREADSTGLGLLGKRVGERGSGSWTGPLCA